MRRYALFLLAGLLFAGALARDQFDRWVAATEIPVLVIETSIEVLDREGRLLRAFTVDDGRWRLAAQPAQVDPLYPAMLIAFEDRRFLRHHGVDWRAMARAAGQALWHGRIVSGGSTLTMQVARLLEDGTTGQMAGKLRQLRLALALERQLTKDEILAIYFERAPFGGNLEGVRAATLAYFGKEPHRLTPAEAALLVAIPQAPTSRRPDRHLANASVARDRVLARVARAGVIDHDTAEAARTTPVPALRRNFPAHAPHLAERLRAEHPLRDVHLTTLDRDLQAALEDLAGESARQAGDRLSTAIVVADHRTGDLLASVGSADYLAETRGGWLDMTRALRSPGSTLKPLVYGLAFDAGLAHPETLIEDRPTAFGRYAPVNFDGQYRGTLRVRRALQMSLNIPVVSLTQAIGPARLVARLRRAGVEPVIPSDTPGLAVALGGVGVTLEDLVRLYGALARGGLAMPLHETGAPDAEPRRVLSEVAAWQVADILAGMPPPAHAARRALAYKTGTSYGHRDAWALGFDGRHVAGVWIGRPDGTAVPGAFGGDLAAPVLFETFGRIAPRSEPLPPPPPAALLSSTAELPLPLQRFRPRNAVFQTATDGPKLAFPPPGTEVEARDGLALKVRDGTPPFTWLANGMPVIVGTRERESFLPTPGKGFLDLSVIDAEGRAARTSVELR
ncbi:penicillin-binding protein 1C [Tropicimonas sp. IMCC6043]|uniref:penicillin-binding protein 1C n=1 Tax=Tropicimonas sp. IMCC6043 TaxID=2510645 RepID=UPI00101BBFA3|nr:penicillin-binding protein 1C [Tropicimonas sp. IMCC6043]RYH10939.1 penicillin-binding protein 1C [Tropicimonas sp. IMCC6043]